MSSLRTHSILFLSCAMLLTASAGCGTVSTRVTSGSGGASASSSSPGPATTTSASTGNGGSGGSAGSTASSATSATTGVGGALPVCGDGVVAGMEACDDGAENSDTTPNACRTTCVKAHCGDSVLDTGEICDDGNTMSGDGCSSTCTATSGMGYDPTTVQGPIVLSNQNLSVSGTADKCAGSVLALKSRASGRWYWEVTATQDGGSNATRCPVITGVKSATSTDRPGWYGFHGMINTVGSSGLSCDGATSYIDSGDVVGVAWDADTGSVQFYKNNALQFDCVAPLGTYFPFADHCNDAFNHCSGTANFGATPFAHTPPAGYSAIY